MQPRYDNLKYESRLSRVSKTVGWLPIVGSPVALLRVYNALGRYETPLEEVERAHHQMYYQVATMLVGAVVASALIKSL